jgi:hypothetical protein
MVFSEPLVKGRYVIPKKENAGVYVNRVRSLNEQMLYAAHLNDRLLVLEEQGDSYKVINDTGQVGWIKKEYVALVKSGAKMGFDPAEVQGYNNSLSPFIITDVTDPKDVEIKFDRSFKEALRENLDRESITRAIE